MPVTTLDALLSEVRGCRACADHLPLGPRPVLRAATTARILVVGQAPGTRVHASGVPWDDPSGDRLRDWMGVDSATFYDERRIAIIPMGLCYPGKGPSGDLPPRRECAELWHERLLAHLVELRLVLLIGAYAVQHYGRSWRKPSLTAAVAGWREVPAPFVPLPHPSPRNIGWRLRNPWLESELVPELRRRVATVL
ncbi:MAG: uracil-DNA glycosylase family protein [Geminicoccaceae bacterium]|nr:uracil-DNA glycosylase family protein [Geminicoccaceae bacterium]